MITDNDNNCSNKRGVLLVLYGNNNALFVGGVALVTTSDRVRWVYFFVLRQLLHTGYLLMTNI